MMKKTSAILSLSLATSISSQHIGTYTPEVHPQLPIQSCSARDACTNLSTSVTLDLNWRWIHIKDGYLNCYSDNSWNTTACPDNKSCAANCAVDGADYKRVYSVTTTPAGALNVKLMSYYDYSSNMGSRLFLMATDTKYHMFKLLNREFSFEVDLSTLPCGVNAAMSLVEMDEDGGMKKYPTNKAGAQYGAGYCSAKCPRDLRFINGEANSEGWVPSALDPVAGTGKFGSCCAEMNIWESNSLSTALTAHSCSTEGSVRCQGAECTNGMCDKDGCDLNSYRTGDIEFYGPNKTVNTSKPFTVLTQFITHDNSDNGILSEIKRQYIQNGTVISNSITKVPSITPTASINGKFCSQQKVAFNDTDHFSRLGGMQAVGGALGRGMVLAISLLADYDDHMLWLDGPFPKNGDPMAPGIKRGPCDADSGDPRETARGRPQVTYRNIRMGTIGSTVHGLH